MSRLLNDKSWLHKEKISLVLQILFLEHLCGFTTLLELLLADSEDKRMPRHLSYENNSEVRIDG